jgi:hypothetical protein
VHLVQCKNKECTAVAVIDEHDVDVHSALDAAGCACCPQDHHHGQAAAVPGAVPCRPVVITMMPGSAEVVPAAGS